MSGLILRVGAAVIAVAVLSGPVDAAATPGVPDVDTASSADDTGVAPLSAAPESQDGNLPLPIASGTGATAIPVPPGVVFGLVGLASAAVARRRYLKRH